MLRYHCISMSSDGLRRPLICHLNGVRFLTPQQREALGFWSVIVWNSSSLMLWCIAIPRKSIIAPSQKNASLGATTGEGEERERSEPKKRSSPCCQTTIGHPRNLQSLQIRIRGYPPDPPAAWWKFDGKMLSAWVWRGFTVCLTRWTGSRHTEYCTFL